MVVDESHNFRNNTPGKRDEEGNIIRKSRYERMMDDIIKAGVKTKVLLLSATPVNNHLKDHPAKRKIRDLLDKLGSDFFKLLDELTIARSRKHIQKYYAATIAELLSQTRKTSFLHAGY